MPEKFTIMEGITLASIPWAIIGPHEKQAWKNHQQTLAHLNQRGGLSPCEALAVIEDRQWKHMPTEDAEAFLSAIVKQY